MTNAPKQFIISLRWKFILSFVAMLMLIGVVIGVMAMNRFNQQLEEVISQKHDSLYRDYQHRLRAEHNRLIELNREILFRLSDKKGLLQLQHLRSELDENWSDFELFGGLYGLQLLDAELQPLLIAGINLNFQPVWTSAQRAIGTPSSYIHCEQACYVGLLVPIVIDGKPSFILYTTSFEAVIAPLVEFHQVQLAVLGGASEPRKGAWGRNVLSLSNRSSNIHVLAEVSQRLPLQKILLEPQRLRFHNKSWSFTGWELTNEGEQLLLFKDIGSLAEGERSFIRDLVSILLIAGVLASVLGLALFWLPLARIRRLSKVLPLLGQSRFDDLRRRLGRSDQRWGDELISLENATLDVAGQLERLEGDLERYTEELQRMAMIDSLTGLPNRAMFQHELSKALSSIGRTDDQISLLFLDLDDFKRVNDTLGHDIGDELLKAVANRLQKSVRSMDTVCRLGGDEFTVIVRGLESEPDIHRIIHQIFASLQQPLQLGNQTLLISTSIGVAFCDNPMMHSDELIKRADLAMYQAKQAGRSNYRVFNEQMQQSASRRLQLTKDVELAIDQQQLSLALQPIISLQQDRVVGFEGLCRWHHPVRGLIMPGTFMKEIDDSVSGRKVGFYVIEQACELLARLSTKLANDEFYLSLNLSPCQYLQSGLVEHIRAQLQRHQLRPNRLVLELTEEVLIKSLDVAMQVMHQLKDMGIQIAIDDFGTGYSSLTYLKQLPFDLLKVDQGFVSDLDNSDVDRNIVTNVIDLAHTLNRSVVAEGVENHDQRQFLKRINCDYAQGYLFAAPMDEHQLVSSMVKLGPELNWSDSESLSGRRSPSEK
ncbi:putative bifunctional diguanylate cyclase/phosphodiesterase [Ferrimonas lipolytica]|uniref:EAL domain-containing protein n=1 Tax=Ferrimonas lipolytica TaxID=2724191 RepID=A0A6H1U8Z8_9GAMM|nr:EAL domain-containing protein [Ferrimonas lipolytica]QIZ75517.1 EAL domain-containing protein [Ferrimonas lipolytica]